MSELKKELESRGFLHQYTHEQVFDKFDKGGQKFYFGVDCSADSMTIGNFVALQMAIHFMLKGNKCFLLVGGATSTIGNPSGKDTERPILTEEDLAKNQAGITKQFDVLVKNVEKITGKKLDYEIVNNYDFFKNMNILEFLKEVGRFMTVNWMMGKDIVKKRIEDPKKFISYAEFSYMLIMGYDFYHLYKNEGVTLEVGGSDEWDGILSGIELISKKEGAEVYGVTNKLIMDANGKKFGKSEGNAIWLDKTKSSPYFMYQYFMNVEDADIERFLKLFTYLEQENIENIAKKHFESPEKREGQKKLAYEVVKIIHGEKDAILSEKLSDFLFGNENKIGILSSLDENELKEFQKEVGGKKYEGEDLLDLLLNTGLILSRGQGKKDVKSGAVYLNEEKVTDINQEISFKNNVALLKKGKKKYAIISK